MHAFPSLQYSSTAKLMSHGPQFEIERHIDDAVFTTVFQSWTFDPWIITPLVLAAGVYARGWWELHRRIPGRFTVWRLIAFQAGLLTLFLALASPLHPLAELLLQFHMIQHLLLMMVVPPLLLLGAPTLPLLRGLPRPVLQGLGPLFASTVLQRLGHFLTHPIVCLVAFTVSNVAWHVPVCMNWLSAPSSGTKCSTSSFLVRGSSSGGRYTALAEPAALAAVDDDPLSLVRGYPEHSAVGFSDFLRARSLSDLCGGAALVGHLGVG